VAALFVAFAAFLRHPKVYPWTIFTLDYFLGNPSGLRTLRDELFRDEYDNFIPKSVIIPPLDLPQMNAKDFSFESFKFLTNELTTPAVIRGLFADAPCLKWTPEKLANHFGNNRTFSSFVNNKIGDATKKNAESCWVSVPELVKNVSQGGNNYIFNAPFEVEYDVPLYKDMEVDRFSKHYRKPAIVQFFLGLARPGESRVGGSVLHAATAPNLNVQYSGSKRWLLIDPKYARYVKPNLFSTQLAVLANATYEYPADARWTNFPRFETLLHPGDALWIPSWWFHEVHNLQGKDWQISVAIRYAHYWSSLQNNWHFTGLVDLGASGKPCWRGLRLTCLQLHPGWDTYGYTALQNSSATLNEIKANKILSDDRYE